MATSASQLRFSARPTVEVYPGWNYDHKSYLSDHDWRVDYASTSGAASTSEATTRLDSGNTRMSKRTNKNVSARPLVTNTLLFSRRTTPDQPKHRSNTNGSPDALEEYNFTVFKGRTRNRRVSGKKSNESNWWNTEETQQTGKRRKDVVGANSYQVKTSKTISIHGEKVYEMLDMAAEDKTQGVRAAAAAAQGSNEVDGFKVDVTRRKLFGVREPPVRERNAGEKETIEKVRANSFLRNAPSTYVDSTTTVISDKEGELIDKRKFGTKQNKPVWVSSTLLEDNLDHTNKGAMNALRYVEERSRKFALAQSVAKLNHRMKKNHATRKLEEQTLRPMKETIVKLERRQGELENENKELQQLVKELAEVIEDHNRHKFEETTKTKAKKTRKASGGAAKTSATAAAIRTRRLSGRASTSSYERTERKVKKSRPPFDLSPGKAMQRTSNSISNPKTETETETETEAGLKKPTVTAKTMTTPPRMRTQRSQWIQPRMTAKQTAMAERTQAFQNAMSYMSKNKGLGKNEEEDIEKTLEVFAKAQAEAELRRDDDDYDGYHGDRSNVSPIREGQSPSQEESLVGGLERRLKQVTANFSAEAIHHEKKRSPSSQFHTNIVVVPTSGAQSQKIETKRSEAPLSKTLRDDLMQAVQMELQKQITGHVESEGRRQGQGEGSKKANDSGGATAVVGRPTRKSATPDFEAFMDDTNKKLEAISKQLITLQGLGAHPSEEGNEKGQDQQNLDLSKSSSHERIVIVRPPAPQGAQDLPFLHSAAHSHSKTAPKTRLESTSTTSAPSSSSGQGKSEGNVTFSTIKKNTVQTANSPLATSLIVGPSDGHFDLIRDRRRALKKLSDLSLRSIQEGREAYLRQQTQNDEFVYANTASQEFDPVKIAETLTELLIEDLLEDSAKELSQVCDSICDNVFEQEFNTEDSQATAS